MISVFLPIRTVSEANSRDGWRAKARRAREHRGVAKIMCSVPFAAWNWNGRLPNGHIRVLLTRLSNGVLDTDNLNSACKACRDGIADALGVDDADPRVEWLYAQERCAPKKFGIRVTAEAVADERTA